MMNVVDVDPIGAMGLVGGSGAILLDVREDDEWTAGHAPGAVHVRLGDLDTHVFDTTTPIVAVCRSGGRSRSASMKLAATGGDRLQPRRRYDGLAEDRATGDSRRRHGRYRHLIGNAVVPPARRKPFGLS